MVKLNVNINILLREIAPSLETILIWDMFEKVLILLRKRKKLRPEMIKSNKRMKVPRDGSFANACTETNIPDLTKNVPNKLSKKVIIHKNIVQF